MALFIRIGHLGEVDLARHGLLERPPIAADALRGPHNPHKRVGNVWIGREGRSVWEGGMEWGGENKMPPSGDVRYVYSPDTLQVMGAAFDTALLSLPPNLQDHEGARRKLALIILRHADRGEPDADLGTLALLDFKRASQ